MYSPRNYPSYGVYADQLASNQSSSSENECDLNSKNLSRTKIESENGDTFSSSIAVSNSPPNHYLHIDHSNHPSEDKIGHLLMTHFTPNQIICICEALLQSESNDKLARFVCSIPDNSVLNKDQTVLRARARVAYNYGNYKELYRIVESRDFDSIYHKELQLLW